MTGATGYIGSKVARELKERGHDVVALVRSKEAADRITSLGYRPVIGDMREPEGWKAEAAAAEALIHLAAIQIERRGGMSWLRTLDDANMTALHGLIEAAKEGGKCKALINTSAFLTVGDHGDAWIDEDTPLTPGLRGKAYLEGEKLVEESYRQGLPGVSLRLGLVYGASGFFAKMILSEAAKGKFSYIGSGNNYMSLVSLADAVDAYVRAVENPPIGKVLNIADDEPLRMREMGAILLNEFGGGKLSGVPVWVASIFAGRPIAEAMSGSYRVKNERAKALLRWRPTPATLREGIKDVVDKYVRKAEKEAA
jgi:nucleoside-diphosphate-sugar epimerase